MTPDFDFDSFGNVVVLMGGRSAERDISLASGRAVCAALERLGIQYVPMDVDDALVARLQSLKPDRVFIALHGKEGEDGTIQALLEFLQIPYTGSGVLASALAMDKSRAKQMWAANGLPTPDHLVLEEHDSVDVDALLARFGFPLCIKPIWVGSSLGVSKVKTRAQILPAIELARRYDQRVMTEPWLGGSDYTIGIVGDCVLPVIEIRAAEEFYNHTAKYEVETTQYICPCDLSPERQTAMQSIAKAAYDVLGCRHWGRVDFVSDVEGNPFLIEVNTVPGLTDHSLVPKAALQAGMSFDALIVSILSQTLER